MAACIILIVLCALVAGFVSEAFFPDHPSPASQLVLFASTTVPTLAGLSAGFTILTILPVQLLFFWGGRLLADQLSVPVAVDPGDKLLKG
jgi:hypothetical protein